MLTSVLLDVLQTGDERIGLIEALGRAAEGVSARAAAQGIEQHAETLGRARGHVTIPVLRAGPLFAEVR